MATTYSTHRFGAAAFLNFFRDLKYASPLFGPCLLWPNSWMDQDTTWYGGMPRPRRHCVRWGPTSSGREAQQSPTFRSTVLARIFAGPHFTHDPFCRLGSARRAALVAILPELPPV